MIPIPPFIPRTFVLLLALLLGSQYPALSQSVLFSTFGGIVPGAFGTNSQAFLDTAPPGIVGYDNAGADDFFVPAGDAWGIRTVRVNGNYSNIIDPMTLGPAVSVNVYILTDAGGPSLPVDPTPNLAAASLYAAEGLAYTDTGIGDFEIVLPGGGVNLAGGAAGTRYWLVVQANMAFLVGGQWNWTESTSSSGSTSAWMQDFSGVLTTPLCVDMWGTRAACNVDGGGTEQDLAFELVGFLLPVELVAFEGLVDDGDVVLQWETASETNNAGFEVQHLTRQNDWEVIIFIEGAGTTLEAQTYTYRIADLQPGQQTFRLKQIDFDGAFEYSPEVEVLIEVPGAYTLHVPYPNPFQRSARFDVAVPSTQQVRITLHDITGRQVQPLFDGEIPAHRMHTVHIDGSELSDGVYLYHISGETFETYGKIAKIR